MSHRTTESNDTRLTSMDLLLNETSSRHMCTTLLNADEFQLHGFDENIKSISVAKYSDTSPLNDDEDDDHCDDEFGPTYMRFVVIVIASFAFSIQVFSQSIWNAIYEPALKAFPNWTSQSLILLPIWGSVMSAVLVFPTCVVINRYGLKRSLLCSCVVFTLGTAVRCLPFIHTSTLCLHLSAMCLSAGGVFMTPLTITISAQWFPKNERNFATGFCTAVGFLGSAATYIIGPIVVSTASELPPEDPYVMRRNIMTMLYVCLGLNMFTTILVLVIFPMHIRPVSYPSMLSMASHRNAKLTQSLGKLIKNVNVWCLVLAFTLSNTVSAPWLALLPSTFSKLHVPPETSAQCGLYLIVHNFALSLSISTFADMAPGYSKEIALFSRLVSLVFLFWLMLMMDFGAKLTTTTLVCVVLMAFPYCFCNQSLFYEMGVELMHPLPESFVAGYMTLLNNLFVDFTYVVLYLFPHFGDYWLHIGVFVFSALSMVFLLFTSNQCEEQSERKIKYSRTS